MDYAPGAMRPWQRHAGPQHRFLGARLVSNATRKVDRKQSKHGAAGEPDSNVGQALRTVYEKVAAESVPSEMLDLLSKLK